MLTDQSLEKLLYQFLLLTRVTVNIDKFQLYFATTLDNVYFATDVKHPCQLGLMLHIGVALIAGGALYCCLK